MDRLTFQCRVARSVKLTTVLGGISGAVPSNLKYGYVIAPRLVPVVFRVALDWAGSGPGRCKTTSGREPQSDQPTDCVIETQW